MTITRVRPVRAVLALAASLLAAQLLHAETKQESQATGGSYTMRKQVIGAGEVSSVGSYRLTGTIGEAGAEESTAPRFRLIGGFHGPIEPIVDSIFCDGFEDAGCPEP